MESFKKLSIQVGLNGLSFCILDTVNNSIVDGDKKTFEIEQTPFLLLKELKTMLDANHLIGKRFSEVKVIHRNQIFSLVPKALFNKNNLLDYLKFNAKTSFKKATFDDLNSFEIINVFAPFEKIDEYIVEVFGESKRTHNTTIFLQTLLTQPTLKGKHCLVNVLEKEVELAVISDKKLLIYNQHRYNTKEDFLYHLLFTFEQLGISTEDINLLLFGVIKEEDTIFKLAYEYVRNISVIQAKNKALKIDIGRSSFLDFTLLNSF